MLVGNVQKNWTLFPDRMVVVWRIFVTGNTEMHTQTLCFICHVFQLLIVALRW